MLIVQATVSRAIDDDEPAAAKTDASKRDDFLTRLNIILN